MTFKKADMGKIRYDLFPPEALDGVAKVLTFGASKYDDNNWRQGCVWGRLFGACMRHLWAFWRGFDDDDETGLSHLDHAICCLMFLSTFIKEGLGKDDRVKRNERGSL